MNHAHAQPLTPPLHHCGKPLQARQIMEQWPTDSQKILGGLWSRAPARYVFPQPYTPTMSCWWHAHHQGTTMMTNHEPALTPFMPIPSQYGWHSMCPHAYKQLLIGWFVGMAQPSKDGMGWAWQRRTQQQAPSTQHLPLQALACRVDWVLMVGTSFLLHPLPCCPAMWCFFLFLEANPLSPSCLLSFAVYCVSSIDIGNLYKTSSNQVVHCHELMKIFSPKSFEVEFECAKSCQRWGKMHFAFLFVDFSFQGFHSSHFWLHFWTFFHSLFDQSPAKLTKRSQKGDQKVAKK